MDTPERSPGAWEATVVANHYLSAMSTPTSSQRYDLHVMESRHTSVSTPRGGRGELLGPPSPHEPTADSVKIT